MVAELSVSLRKFVLIQIGDIRNENVDISSDKQCVETLSP